MAHRFTLGKDVREMLDELRAKLADLGVEIEQAALACRDEANEHQEAYEQAAERWQESERGAEVSDWITAIDGLADEIEELGTAVDTLGGNIDDLEDKP